MTPPAEVGLLLDALARGVTAALPDNVVGVYLRGSLATGGFRAESDVDVLVVTEQPVTDAEMTRLDAMHHSLAALPGPYASRLEIAYVDRRAMRRYSPGERHPTLYQGEAFARSEHDANWVLERWAVREHGVALVGPRPVTLIDLIEPGQIRGAVRERLTDWAAWAAHPEPPGWPILYTVETLCRALHTLATGQLATKAEAVAWAAEHLPEPWRATVWEARRRRAAGSDDRAGIEAEALAFARWASADPLSRAETAP